MDISVLTKKLVLKREIGSIESPMTPWEVYEMGLVINEVIANIYQILYENCTDREMLQHIVKYNQIEADTLKDRINLHKNYEMLDYYGSRGRIIHSIAGKVNQIFFDNFDSEVKIFLNELNRLLEAINYQKSEGIPFNNVETRNFCKNISNYACNFYQTILDLYPSGETKDALDDIYCLSMERNNYLYN